MNILLTNGLVYTMVNDEVPNVCDVLINGKKISKIGKNLTEEGARVIDCTGKVVLPGLIDAHCHIGVFGSAMGERGVDGNETTSANTPELRGIDGINPFDVEFKHSYINGVTCVSTGPGSANPICGQFVTMKTYGKTFDEMIVREPSAMKMAFGENPKSAHNGAAPVTRMGTAAIIREALFKAKRYALEKQKAEKEKKPLPAFDMKLEALVPVVEGLLPVKAHAHRADDILTALRIAKEFDLDMSIEHCSEGHLIPDQLAYANGVIIGPLIGFPHKLEVANQSPKAGRILYENGVKFAIMSDLPATHTRDILIAAGACIREGLPMLEAIKAITINAAQILKVDDRVGSIAAGKDADITVFTENPVESVNATCVLTLIEGEIIHNRVE
ncbi:amidohydrolase [Vallitalea longa]|uniref:Amidohydrolase n=1 Tax=Vallitalea longa TaxID=2936439 RepID=A0A9W5Y9L5_9FIRM|nr:amidohydrolase [Vallitalea longa]GKX28328.1 amidohydrolase [Vallitalea longa]